MFKKLFCLIIVAGLFFSILSGYPSQAKAADSGKPVVIEIAHSYPTEHILHQAVLLADKVLQKKSGGRIKLKIYPNGTYGDQMNSLQAVRMGALDMFEMGPYADYYKPIAALFGPYLFRDYNHWDKFVKSKYCKELFAKFEQGAGVKVLAPHHAGFRYVVTRNKPAKTPDDFAGMKLRVVNQPPYPEAATVLNATATPLPITEVYMALKTGVVDATENPLIQIYSTKFYEVTKYLILTQHMITPVTFIMSNQRWNSLSVQDKKIVEEAFNQAARFNDSEIKKQEAGLIKKLQELGLTVIKPNKKLFSARTALVLKKYPEWKEIYQKIEAIK
jgi:tripartite ATP-independent transporter DctP family solute receptor